MGFIIRCAPETAPPISELDGARIKARLENGFSLWQNLEPIFHQNSSQIGGENNLWVRVKEYLARAAKARGNVSSATGPATFCSTCRLQSPLCRGRLRARGNLRDSALNAAAAACVLSAKPLAKPVKLEGFPVFVLTTKQFPRF